MYICICGYNNVHVGVQSPLPLPHAPPPPSPLPPPPADVLGHPFGKVPPPRPFEGCTSEEAEVILNDPCNPVGKKLLAGQFLVHYLNVQYTSLSLHVVKWATVIVVPLANHIESSCLAISLAVHFKVCHRPIL